VQTCPRCGKPLRYIPASVSMSSHGQGIYTVEAEPITLITERGRPVTGYKVHKCGEGENGSAEKEDRDGGQG
jgi:hypothetical protein